MGAPYIYDISRLRVKKCDAGEANYGIGMKLIRQFESEIGYMDRHKHSMIWTDINIAS